MAEADVCLDINTVARFLANDEIEDLASHEPVDCIVFCISSVLYQAEKFFTILQERPSLTRTLVLVGGIGHSTSLLYDAIARHERYSTLQHEAVGLPEARVMELILKKYHDMDKITSSGCRVLIEDKSTNCGSNAIETRRVLQNAGLEFPQNCIIVQDPTMSLRTMASFEKAYNNAAAPMKFSTCPLFVPTMRGSWPQLHYSTPAISASSLWPLRRFFELLVGEIPRLRDDENGYGPQGKRFISHVEVPADVEEAWARLCNVIGTSDR